MNELPLILAGLYTIVYVIVFFIQQRQINSSKEIIQSMKSFIEIFKVDELKKYADLRDESMKLKIEMTLNNDENVKKISNDAVKEFVNNTNPQFMIKLKEVQDKQQSERIAQLSYFVAKVLLDQPKSKRDIVLDKELSCAKNIIEGMINDLEKTNESPQSHPQAK